MKHLKKKKGREKRQVGWNKKKKKRSGGCERPAVLRL